MTVRRLPAAHGGGEAAPLPQKRKTRRSLAGFRLSAVSVDQK